MRDYDDNELYDPTDGFIDDYRDEFLDNALDLDKNTPAESAPRPADSRPPHPAPGTPAKQARPTGGSPSRPSLKSTGKSPQSSRNTPPSGSDAGQPGASKKTTGASSPHKPGSKSGASNRSQKSESSKTSKPPTPAKKTPARPPASGKTPPARPNSNSGVRSLPGVEGVKVKSRTPARPASPVTPPEPDWIRHIQKDIPPYADEMLAFLLIAIGLLSFFTLLSPSSGALGTAWSDALSQAFGIGAFAISAVILAAGALLLVPKLGIEVRVNWWRIIAGEFFYIFLLACIHAGIRARAGGEAGEVEAFARAMEGRGGGFVGWAIQDLIHILFGDMITGLVLLALLAFTATWMVGIGRRNILNALTRLHDSLTAYAARQDAQRIAQAAPAGHPTTPAAGETPPPAANPATGPVKPDRSALELPAIPGRPSIVTGERGYVALGLRRSEVHPIRISGSPGADDGGSARPKPDLAFEYRFTAKDLPDKKRIRKRPDTLPPLELMDSIDFDRPAEDEINRNAAIIEKTVADFGMKVEVIDVKAGPTVTQYAVQPFTEIEKDGQKIVERVRVTRVTALAQDLSLTLAAPSVRIQAPVPGTNYIGIEVPNARPGIVSLRPVIESEQFYKVRSPLAIALGREVDGKPTATDLGAMPHLLIGGTTGSGKSVCITAIATCLIANNRPDQLRLIMIDPKMVELVRFNGLPHLLGRVEVQLDRIIGVLRWLTREMDRRYKLMEEAMARNIAVYNKGRRRRSRLPYIVVLIDELAELMTEFPDETEHLLTRLAQMARATGIHLVVATQRPSTDILTGLIKANFPARIAFAVPSGVDSRVIIDTVGAEDLIGRGDMLFQAPDAMAPVRLQGCFVSDAEMERTVEFWHKNWHEHEEMAPWERALTRAAILDETDEMLEEAIRVIQREGEASASQLQRRLNVGYPRAGRIMDALYRIGVVGVDPGGGRPREVLIAPDADPTTYIVNWRNGQN
jgi:hypothetical protein